MRIGYRATCVWCDRVIEDSTWLVDGQDGQWHNECADEVLRVAYQRRSGGDPRLPAGRQPEYSLAAPTGSGEAPIAAAPIAAAPIAESPIAVAVNAGTVSGGTVSGGTVSGGTVSGGADVPPLKRCTKCGKEYAATPEFFHRSNGKLKPYCKQCANKYWQEYYEKKGKAEASAPAAPVRLQAAPEPMDPLTPDMRLTPIECRRRREALRMTPETLAQRANVGGAALEGYEAGSIILSEDALRRIRKVLLATDAGARLPVPLAGAAYPARSNGTTAVR